MRARNSTLAWKLGWRGSHFAAGRVKQFSPVPVVRLSFTPSERARVERERERKREGIPSEQRCTTYNQGGRGRENGERERERENRDRNLLSPLGKDSPTNVKIVTSGEEGKYTH